LYYATKTVNIFNKEAKFDYEIIETFNAGIVLQYRNKIIRLGKQISLKSFVIQQQRTFCNKYIYRRIYFGNHQSKKSETDGSTFEKLKGLLKVFKPKDLP
jgi:SsrA-binding protein